MRPDPLDRLPGRGGRGGFGVRSAAASSRGSSGALSVSSKVGSIGIVLEFPRALALHSPDPRDQRHKAPLRREINHVFAAEISKEEQVARANFGGHRWLVHPRSAPDAYRCRSI
jgi:hypothetical protein